mmetsp:Transcript_93474/g.296575  ORF Transcript_93474/g.296575 Transcript_93474/m.296575 type:complete len:201 (+) Transcript_93474:575-1177(+)
MIELLAVLEELGLGLVKAWLLKEAECLRLRRPVAVLKLGLAHGEPAQDLLLHPPCVLLHRVPQAVPQLVLHCGRPRRLYRGHRTVVDRQAVLRGKIRKHRPRDGRAANLLGLKCREHLVHKGLDLRSELRPQRFVGHLLDAPQVRFVRHRPHQRHAVALRKEVPDRARHAALLLVTQHGLKGVLQVLMRGDGGAPGIHEP